MRVMRMRQILIFELRSSLLIKQLNHFEGLYPFRRWKVSPMVRMGLGILSLRAYQEKSN